MNGQRPRRWRGERQERRAPLGRNRTPQASPEVEERIRELDSDREPMSLAEEIAIENRRNGEAAAARPPAPTAERGSTFAELQSMDEAELRQVATTEQVSAEGLGKRELVFQI
ncbi:MAG: hypothetical protein KDA45_13075, partial [Planctomycetales bacterium]|nr:hypothetical protein [Planctomycetales bacterium]